MLLPTHHSYQKGCKSLRINLWQCFSTRCFREVGRWMDGWMDAHFGSMNKLCTGAHLFGKWRKSFLRNSINKDCSLPSTLTNCFCSFHSSSELQNLSIFFKFIFVTSSISYIPPSPLFAMQRESMVGEETNHKKSMKQNQPGLQKANYHPL